MAGGPAVSGRCLVRRDSDTPSDTTFEATPDTSAGHADLRREGISVSVVSERVRDHGTPLAPVVSAGKSHPLDTGAIRGGQQALEKDTAGPELRPYQRAIVAAVLHELEAHRSTLAVAATGTGKTICFAELARLEVARGGRVLILVHRDELLRQAGSKCEAVGLSLEVEKGAARASDSAAVVLGSVQSLRGVRLTRWARGHFSLIIVDEAHRAAARGYVAILDHFETAKIAGFTATADRGDGRPLGEVFATVAAKYEIKQAIAERHLVPIRAQRVLIDGVDLSKVATRAGDFAEDALAEVMGDERAVRGVVVPLLALAGTRSTIAFCAGVGHAHSIAAALNELQPGCAHAVSGKTPAPEREALLAAHSIGEFQFLCNSDLLIEGFDSPRVSCTAMVRPTKSRGRYVQCAGRALRPHPESGKVDALILDFSATAGRHRLIGPIDCLAGSELADEVRDEVSRLLGETQLELRAVIEAAELEVSRRREAVKVAAIVHWRTEHLDPFVGDLAPAPTTPWSTDLATDAQRRTLEAAGLTDLPAQLTKGEASRWLDALARRRQLGLCTLKQCRLLRRQGIDARQMTFAEAGEHIARLKQTWRALREAA